jgi:hypothetical protein
MDVDEDDYEKPRRFALGGFIFGNIDNNGKLDKDTCTLHSEVRDLVVSIVF